jgi:catechol 2,3-dioxygenase-like lactoylglutathione lyase family enzyme
MFRAGLGTDNLERANPFYDAVLGALGHTRCDAAGGSDWGDWVGWGRPAVAGNGTTVALRA